jgi:2-oxoglutarate dehydrogenase E1 component
MGCWNHVERYINRALEYIKANSKKVKYVGRMPSASPATGYVKKHLAQQQEIVTKAITT